MPNQYKWKILEEFKKAWTDLRHEKILLDDDRWPTLKEVYDLYKERKKTH